MNPLNKKSIKAIIIVFLLSSLNNNFFSQNHKIYSFYKNYLITIPHHGEISKLTKKPVYNKSMKGYGMSYIIYLEDINDENKSELFNLNLAEFKEPKYNKIDFFMNNHINSEKQKLINEGVNFEFGQTNYIENKEFEIGYVLVEIYPKSKYSSKKKSLNLYALIISRDRKLMMFFQGKEISTEFPKDSIFSIIKSIESINQIPFFNLK